MLTSRFPVFRRRRPVRPLVAPMPQPQTERLPPHPGDPQLPTLALWVILMGR